VARPGGWEPGLDEEAERGLKSPGASGAGSAPGHQSPDSAAFECGLAPWFPGRGGGGVQAFGLGCVPGLWTEQLLVSQALQPADGHCGSFESLTM
jgi:hypothetical protein